MIKWIHILIVLAISTCVFGQSDATIISDSDRSVEDANRLKIRPTLYDTVIPSPDMKYPLLVLQEQTSFELNDIEPATIRHRPQLSQLYNGYAKIGGGSRLMGLGEVYYNNKRSRKYNWGIHAQHLSEWGQISDYAPSQYDRTRATVFGDVRERRYSYGGSVKYLNQGLHYYGFENPNASRDSIRQRFNNIGFSGYYASHVKDSNQLNYKIGLDYSYFTDRKPGEDTLSKWRARENYVALTSKWQYNSSNNKLLANMNADFDILHNDYRYGIADTSIAPLDTGLVRSNTVLQLRPTTTFYGKDERLKVEFGGELAIDIASRTRATVYPIAEVKYSLFDDLFIPYIGTRGGLTQQRFQTLANENEFINSNIQLRNLESYNFNFGIKGTLSKRMSFNLGANFSHNRNVALFANDTVYSSGNQFRAIYDTINISTITGSLSYQMNEELRVDGIVNLHSYQARNNPYAWNLPQLEFILRGKYNVANKLIVNLDFTLEGGRRALVYDSTIPNTKEEDGVYFVPLGLIADANLGVEYRYTPRVSFFGNLNNFAAQRYQRWFNYPVQAFQFMLGASFRF